jgi:hypothetical protein
MMREVRAAAEPTDHEDYDDDQYDEAVGNFVWNVFQRNESMPVSHISRLQSFISEIQDDKRLHLRPVVFGLIKAPMLPAAVKRSIPGDDCSHGRGTSDGEGVDMHDVARLGGEWMVDDDIAGDPVEEDGQVRVDAELEHVDGASGVPHRPPVELMEKVRGLNLVMTAEESVYMECNDFGENVATLPCKINGNTVVDVATVSGVVGGSARNTKLVAWLNSKRGTPALRKVTRALPCEDVCDCCEELNLPTGYARGLYKYIVGTTAALVGDGCLVPCFRFKDNEVKIVLPRVVHDTSGLWHAGEEERPAFAPSEVTATNLAANAKGIRIRRYDESGRSFVIRRSCNYRYCINVDHILNPTTDELAVLRREADAAAETLRRANAPQHVVDAVLRVQY